ncbi:MAG: sulfoxide reductase heme-binding subunit YedZ [Polynucleobacter sp. 16-46-70]|jgi:sulfoxide reductase heme-binding subunit YedZ|nr:MAG: sulfoxide reductase heme-binding subunit YedZ [Polynucleobacter sp. 16-46-70]HQS61278.1 protein-methionine-sulfoxide reductase heme-binding subunit MsrQ [Polynucleobacter sp.]HQT20513.1 protein-methionine-sulfoxide reductase heme-binding subunit MsrQ [Polynucleobacter sp.]HQT41015.1 protein-methionine-sulfoxide reductase heme-binding subunit MsrQ [Polynucleobacter sp.]
MLISLVKPLIFLAALLPLGRLVWLVFTNDLGANPIELITRSTGTWALVFLCLTLAMTPLRLLTNQVIWIRYRRMLGLFSFFYACLHFSIWLWLDLDWNLLEMGKDVIKRPFITMGFLSFVMLIPLALSSNHWMQRKLGRRWAQLHRMVYLIAITVILHYWWHKAGKNDLDTVSIYALIVILLLSCRIPYVRKRLSLKLTP